MRKLICLVVVLALAFSFVACNAQNNNNNGDTKGTTPQATTNQGTPQDNQGNTTQQQTTKPTVTYKDGSYTAAADKWQYGQEDATVEIAGGKISKIVLRRLDTAGKEVNYDDWTGQTKDNKKYPNLKQYRLDLANRMVENQTFEVDVISGATQSSTGWKVAVQKALEQAKTK